MSVKSGTEQTREVEERSAAPADPEEELTQKLEQIRDLVTRSRAPEAYALAKEMQHHWPESELVQYWVRVLAPPIVRSVPGPDPRSRPRDKERAWLREHGHEYSGCWLAIYEDRLIAADPDLGLVLAEAKRNPEGQRALIYQQPGSPTPK
jgi:hypothetical protein